MSLLWVTANRALARVPMKDLPVHPEPYGISDEDVPAEYAAAGHGYWHDYFHGTYSFHQVPLKDLHDHEHDARCYLPTKENQARHDVSPEDYEGQHFDYHQVKHMAKDVDALPNLVGVRDESGHPQYFGGGHRSAAYAEAGRTHIPMWLKDDD